MKKCQIGVLYLVLALVSVSQAALVWRPGEGWTTEGSGESLAASDAKAALQLARNQEAKEDYKSALDTYRSIVRRWPLSSSAGEAQFKVGFMLEKRAEFWDAYRAYQKVVEKYPASQFFDLSIEREFAIANLFLSGEPQKVWKIPLLPSMDKTVEIYNTIIKNAPYGPYAPQSYFKIGLAREKQKNWSDAISSYNKLLDKYPGSDLASAAQYQIGYAWYQASSEPDYDQSAAQKAIDAFNDFLLRFPDSEKVEQARFYISELSTRRVQGSFNIAHFYAKQKNYKAALIYYNDVIQQGPNTPLALRAKDEIDKINKIQGGKPVVNRTPQPAPVIADGTTPATSTPASGTAAEPPPPTGDESDGSQLPEKSPVDVSKQQPDSPPAL